jgi:aspartate-semialdehyde dehydrogenase
MNIVIVGATGNVGRKLLEVLEKLNFEFSELYLIASDKSVGKKMAENIKNSQLEVLKECGHMIIFDCFR